MKSAEPVTPRSTSAALYSALVRSRKDLKAWRIVSAVVFACLLLVFGLLIYATTTAETNYREARAKYDAEIAQCFERFEILQRVEREEDHDAPKGEE